jgi:hypothetical protein
LDLRRDKQPKQRIEEQSGLLQWKVTVSDPSAEKDREKSISLTMLAKMLRPAAPWSASVESHLAEFVGSAPDAYVFLGPKDARPARSNFHTIWDKARQQTGVPQLHLHDLRHTGNTLAEPEQRCASWGSAWDTARPEGSSERLANASIANSVRRWSAMAYPMHALVWQSMTVPRYNQPSPVGMYVISPTIFWPGAWAVKFLFTRSGIGPGSPGTVVVGR